MFHADAPTSADPPYGNARNIDGIMFDANIRVHGRKARISLGREIADHSIWWKKVICPSAESFNKSPQFRERRRGGRTKNEKRVRFRIHRCTAKIHGNQTTPEHRKSKDNPDHFELAKLPKTRPRVSLLLSLTWFHG
jgi:hypothetical protein